MRNLIFISFALISYPLMASSVVKEAPKCGTSLTYGRASVECSNADVELFDLPISDWNRLVCGYSDFRIGRYRFRRSPSEGLILVSESETCQWEVYRSVDFPHPQGT